MLELYIGSDNELLGLVMGHDEFWVLMGLEIMS